MKNAMIFVLFTVIAIFAAAFSYAWAGDAGVNRVLHDGASPFFSVEGYNHTGKKLWLGASFKCGNGSWIDIKPIRIKEKNGPFRKNFTMKLCPQGYTVIRSCLWRGKDGGLMEGRISCFDK